MIETQLTSNQLQGLSLGSQSRSNGFRTWQIFYWLVCTRSTWVRRIPHLYCLRSFWKWPPASLTSCWFCPVSISTNCPYYLTLDTQILHPSNSALPLNQGQSRIRSGYPPQKRWISSSKSQWLPPSTYFPTFSEFKLYPDTVFLFVRSSFTSNCLITLNLIIL